MGRLATSYGACFIRVMISAEQAVLEAQHRFPEYEAEVMSTCGVYRLALVPRLPAESSARAADLFELTDERLYSEGTSYESALAAANPPPVADLKRR